MKQHYFYMEGMWENNNDGMKLISESGKIVLNFNAKQVNIVASESATLFIEYDGRNSRRGPGVKTYHQKEQSKFQSQDCII